MGTSSSSILSGEILEDYLLLSYLNKREIFTLYRILSTLDQDGILKNLNFRFPTTTIEQLFPELKHNPFKDRIFKVFSSGKDEKMSFEDMLDLCSVFSEKCPARVKATYAFEMFDFDDDGEIGENDLMEAMNRLIGGVGAINCRQEKRLVDTLLQNMNFSSNRRSIGELEFVHALGKLPEFPHAFCFKL